MNEPPGREESKQSNCSNSANIPIAYVQPTRNGVSVKTESTKPRPFRKNKVPNAGSTFYAAVEDIRPDESLRVDQIRHARPGESPQLDQIYHARSNESPRLSQISHVRRDRSQQVDQIHHARHDGSQQVDQIRFTRPDRSPRVKDNIRIARSSFDERAPQLPPKPMRRPILPPKKPPRPQRPSPKVSVEYQCRIV